MLRFLKNKIEKIKKEEEEEDDGSKKREEARMGNLKFVGFLKNVHGLIDLY